MSNEEKSKRIAKHILETYSVINQDNLPNALWFAAIHMAEYKDDYYYKVITEIVGAAYNSCEDHSKIDEVLKKYKL